MPACELLSTCPYFNDSTYEMAETDKERYCKGDYGSCGRYIAFKVLERPSSGQLDPYVAAILSREPVETQHAVVAILTILKAISQVMEKT